MAPFFWQKEIAVTESRVGHARKIERRLEVRQTLLPPEKQRPDGDLQHMKEKQQPGNTDQQPGDIAGRPLECKT
jgi:hypothetical protein